MLQAMMLALTLWLPLTPTSDQADLTALIARRVDATVDRPGVPYKGFAWKWSGAGCQSVLEVAQSDDNLFDYSIDWTSHAVMLAGDGKTVSIRGLIEGGRRPVTAAVTLTFDDEGSAASARRAMTRLRNACRPQR